MFALLYVSIDRLRIILGLSLIHIYDALAGLSQEVCAEKKPVKEGGAGQGCGHNLLGLSLIHIWPAFPKARQKVLTALAVLCL